MSPGEGLQLMKDRSTRRKGQPKGLRGISAVRGKEEAGVLDGEEPAGVSLEAVEQGMKPFGPGLG